MIDERAPLPESMGGLFEAALRAYARRLPLYLGLAIAEIAVQSVLAYFVPKSVGALEGALIVCESLLAAIVTIGVIGDLGLAPGRPSDGELFGAGIARWWIVASTSLLLWFVSLFTVPQIFAPNQSPLDYFMILPLAVFLGALSFGPAIAAIDVKTRPELLVFSSIGRSMSLSLMRPNLGRLVVISLIALVPPLLENILGDVLHVRKIGAYAFISTVPIDTLVTGPFQAIFTIFYLDFVRRGANAAGPTSR